MEEIRAKPNGYINRYKFFWSKFNDSYMTITWTMFESVSEELAGGRQDDLVGANHLKAAGQRDVGEEAERPRKR